MTILIPCWSTISNLASYLTCSTCAVLSSSPEPCQRPTSKQLASSQTPSTNQRKPSYVTRRLHSHGNEAAVMWLAATGTRRELSYHLAKTSVSAVGGHLCFQLLQGVFQTLKRQSLRERACNHIFALKRSTMKGELHQVNKHYFTPYLSRGTPGIPL